MRNVVWLVVIILALIASNAGSAEARRVALVIGNAEYKVGPLVNPANDAEAVATAFKRLDFDRVLLRKDLGVERFRAVLSEFARESTGAEVAVVFFAGHGTERDGRNYLIPVDAKLDRASDLDLQAIALSIVLDQIAGATKLKLVILDACRNNVFPVSGVRRSVTRGLARIEPEDNTLVVYAAKEGTLAEDGAPTRHSPFTAALLKHITTPGLEISFVFRRVRDDVARATGNRQHPHLYGTLGGEAIYLLKAAALVTPSAEVEAARKAADAERARLAEERRLLEEERKTLALAVPPVVSPHPSKQTQEETAKGLQEPPPKKQNEAKESDGKRVVPLHTPTSKGPWNGAWSGTWHYSRKSGYVRIVDNMVVEYRYGGAPQRITKSRIAGGTVTFGNNAFTITMQLVGPGSASASYTGPFGASMATLTKRQ